MLMIALFTLGLQSEPPGPQWIFTDKTENHAILIDGSRIVENGSVMTVWMAVARATDPVGRYVMMETEFDCSALTSA